MNLIATIYEISDPVIPNPTTVRPITEPPENATNKASPVLFVAA